MRAARYDGSDNIGFNVCKLHNTPGIDGIVYVKIYQQISLLFCFILLTLYCKVLLNMLTFNFRYFLAALILFAVEILIAVFLHDPVIRPFGGDFLVVILLYCCFKSFLNTSVRRTAFVTLLIAYAIELLQYIGFIYWLRWDNWPLARVVMGTTFQWGDILAYTLGIGFVMMVEQRRRA